MLQGSVSNTCLSTDLLFCSSHILLIDKYPLPYSAPDCPTQIDQIGNQKNNTYSPENSKTGHDKCRKYEKQNTQE